VNNLPICFSRTFLILFGGSIISFLDRAALPTISTLDSKNITDFKSADEAGVIAYIPEEQTGLKSAFTELASRNHEKFTFGIASDKILAQAGNVQVPSVVVHKPREGT
jgi:protein disulfide-isomerase A1